MSVEVERLVVALEARTNAFEKEMKRARQVTDRQMSGVEKRTEQAAKRIESSMARVSRNINTAIGGALAGVSFQQVARYADAYTKVENSLKVAGLEGQELKSTYDQLFAAAQRQSAPIEALATLYGRLSLAQKELNITGPELMRFTEGVATALRVSGQSATEASGALLQLSQALAGGKIQAEEYNSLLDGARPVLQAVAAGLKEADGSVAKLTALVKDGKVSSEAFFRAFEAGQNVLEEMSRNTTPTLGQAMERVNNALTDAAGKMNVAVGATRGFQTAINYFIDDIAKLPAYLQNSIHELERFIQLFGQAKAFVDSGLDAIAGKPTNPIDQAFDADSYAVHGSMRGYKRPVNDESSPLSLRVKPKRQISLGQFPVSGGGGGSKSGGGKSDAEKHADEVKREIESLKERRRETEAEVAALGKNNAEKQTAITLAKLKIDANSAEAQTIRENITAIDAAKEAVDRYEQAQQDAQQAMADFGSTLADAFSDAVLEGENLEEVGKRLLKTFASKAIDSAFSSLFDGKGGGILGGLFGGLSLNPTGRAAGGPVVPGRAYTVGESGRETFVPTTPGRILPMRKGGGGGTVMHSPTYNITPAQGVTPEQLAAVIDRNNRQFARNLPTILNKSQARFG